MSGSAVHSREETDTLSAGAEEAPALTVDNETLEPTSVLRDVTLLTEPDATPSPVDAKCGSTSINGDAPPKTPQLSDATSPTKTTAPSPSEDDIPGGVFSPPEGFADRVAGACYAAFSRLPRRARPQAGREWALLAGVVLSAPPHAQCVPVALGTGSKCLGGSQRSARGDMVSDSHAEVVARRAFLRWLMAEWRAALDGRSEWMERDGESVRLRDGVRVHFFSSHTPCGDCSIFPREGEVENAGPPAKRAREDTAYREGDATDIYRTGAKPVVGEAADPRLPGSAYHVTGVLRTKPGRGDPTLSLSCSDKLARWLRLGVQGALGSLLLAAPLALSSVVVGRCPYSAAAMRRALLDRPGLLAPPAVLQATLEFEHGRAAVERRAGLDAEGAAGGGRVVPSPCSLAWSRGCARELEVSVDGVRQGVTKKARGTAAARVAICRREMMQEFVNMVTDVGPHRLPEHLRKLVDKNMEQLTYTELKCSAEWYVRRWDKLRREAFQNWTEKPSHLSDFRLSE